MSPSRSGSRSGAASRRQPQKMRKYERADIVKAVAVSAAIVAVTAVLGASKLRGAISLFLGLAIGIVGIDFLTGQPRATFGLPQLSDGIDIVVIAVAIFVVLLELAPRVGLSVDWGMIIASLVVSVLTVLYPPEAKALVLISVACLVYGYSMKPLGLVGATAALVFISAYGGHEFKWKEVFVLFVILILFSYLVFVKGLTLPFPMCPAAFSFC